MKVKDIINHSNVEVNNNHESIDGNVVPASSSTVERANRQPAFVFADEFLATFGEYDAEPYPTDKISDHDLPEEITACESGDDHSKGFGRRDDYEWYEINDVNIIFGVW